MLDDHGKPRQPVVGIAGKQVPGYVISAPCALAAVAVQPVRGKPLQQCFKHFRGTDKHRCRLTQLHPGMLVV